LASREEVRRFLAEADGRFEGWTPNEEPVTESHDDMDALRALPELQGAVAAYRRGLCPNEAVVDVRWRQWPNGRCETGRKVVGSLAELARPSVWAAGHGKQPILSIAAPNSVVRAASAHALPDQGQTGPTAGNEFSELPRIDS
jgi:hypothetical protein